MYRLRWNEEQKRINANFTTPEDTFVLDVTGKKNGRGAYLCKSEECLKKAIKSKGLERSFKMSIPKEVYAALEEEFINIEAE